MPCNHPGGRRQPAKSSQGPLQELRGGGGSARVWTQGATTPQHGQGLPPAGHEEVRGTRPARGPVDLRSKPERGGDKDVLVWGHLCIWLVGPSRLPLPASPCRPVSSKAPLGRLTPTPGPHPSSVSFSLLCGLPFRPGTQACQRLPAWSLHQAARELCVRSGPPCSVCRARTQRAAVANKTFFLRLLGHVALWSVELVTGFPHCQLVVEAKAPATWWPGHPPGGRCMDVQPSSPTPQVCARSPPQHEAGSLTPPPCPKPTPLSELRLGPAGEAVCVASALLGPQAGHQDGSRRGQACPRPHGREDGGHHTPPGVQPSLGHHVASRDGPA